MFSVKYTDLLELVSDFWEDISESFRKHFQETIIQIIGSVSGTLAFIIDKGNYKNLSNIDTDFVVYILSIVTSAAVYAFVFSKRGTTTRNRFITFIVSIIFSAFCTESILDYFSIKHSLGFYFLGGFFGFPILDTLAALGSKARDTLPQIFFDFVKDKFGGKKEQ